MKTVIVNIREKRVTELTRTGSYTYTKPQQSIRFQSSDTEDIDRLIDTIHLKKDFNFFNSLGYAKTFFYEDVISIQKVD